MFPRSFENPWTPNPYGVRRFARTLNTSLKIEDSGTELNYNGSANLTVKLPSNFELQEGWNVLIANRGTNVITFTPNGNETVGGVTTSWVCNPGDIGLLTRGPAGVEVDRIAGFNKQIYTGGASGNFTVPAGVYRIFVECWGAGGGCSSSGGGGGGAYCAKLINTTPGALLAYSVGSGGTSAPTAGGTTTFGGVLTAGGGAAGTSSTAFSGGTASGGDTNINGGYSLYASVGNMGGASPRGAQSVSDGSSGINGLVPGGGAVNIAAGGDGLVVVTWV